MVIVYYLTNYHQLTRSSLNKHAYYKKKKENDKISHAINNISIKIVCLLKINYLKVKINLFDLNWFFRLYPKRKQFSHPESKQCNKETVVHIQICFITFI